MTPPPAAAVVRPFLPAKDFALSKRFYEALGFTKLLDGDVAVFSCGGGAGGFVLQAYFDEAFAGHLMMQLMVPDLDAWWAHIEALDLPGRFGVPAPRPPEMQPWGLKIAYVVDPSGVLWHIAQQRDGVAQDGA